jgi:outer membrane receptor protein involved in Fe transport
MRLSYQRSVIHPQLADYVPFPVYDTQLLGTSVNRPIRSSSLQSVDFQVEKQMGAFDFISVGLFYRHINRPIERTTYEYGQDERMYVLQNSDKAVNYGIEANVRKQLGFITDANFIHNIQFAAGFTLTHSSVYGKRMGMKDKDTFMETESIQKRPLSGQMPYLLHIGLNYSDKRLNANLLFNRSSRQLFVLGENAYQHEYKAPFNSMDVVMSYRFPKRDISVKLSGVNLLNYAQIFYTNTPDDYVRDKYNFPTENLLPHKSENYDRGHDPVIHKTYGGRSFSFSVSRTF